MDGVQIGIEKTNATVITTTISTNRKTTGLFIVPPQILSWKLGELL